VAMKTRIHYAWIVLGTVTLVILATSGTRSSFGVFIKPLEQEFGWDRTSMSAVAALSLFLYDRFGSYTVAFNSAAVMAFVATALVLAIQERPLTGPARPIVVAPAAGA